MGRMDADLEDLYRRRHGAFQVMLASVTGSVESARDVVQEAFAQALRDQKGFRGEGSLEGWVWRIALRLGPVLARTSRRRRPRSARHVAAQLRPSLRMPFAAAR
jgi:DNA-directed RNA polymerase specialized sigma24 family protein